MYLISYRDEIISNMYVKSEVITYCYKANDILDSIEQYLSNKYGKIKIVSFSCYNNHIDMTYSFENYACLETISEKFEWKLIL